MNDPTSPTFSKIEILGMGVFSLAPAVADPRDREALR